LLCRAEHQHFPIIGGITFVVFRTSAGLQENSPGLKVSRSASRFIPPSFEREKEVPRLSFVDATVFAALAFAAAPLPPLAATAFAAFVFPAASLKIKLLFFPKPMQQEKQMQEPTSLFLRLSSFLLC
jgi:hypothetical protein